jgi:hypothetical protein
VACLIAATSTTEEIPVATFEVHGQALDGSNLFPSITLLPFKISAIRCVDRDFHLIFADNTDSIWDFAWKFEARI